MFALQKMYDFEIFLRLYKKVSEMRQETFDISKFVNTAFKMSWGTLWRTCSEKKTNFQKFTRTVQGSFWGESLFSNGNFFNLSVHVFETNTSTLTKSKKKITELSKLNSTCPEELFEKKLSSWGKKLFLSSIVETKNLQSSKRNFTTEIMKLV